jgi:hypothetical protein
MRKEGQVELLPVETPNGLSANATLANGDRQCQYYFNKSPLPVQEKPSAFQPRTFLHVRYKVKLTANS